MKRMFSLILITCLLFTSAVPVFAADTESKSLEKAILAVKQVVTIPGDYKVFNYSSNEYGYEDVNRAVWSLNWNTEDGSSGISATVDMEGRLIHYYHYADRQNSGLGTTSKEEGLKIAKDFLAKAMPETSKDLQLVERKDTANTYRYYYDFKLHKNQVKVDFVQVRLEVDKYSRDVVSFNGIEDYSLVNNLPGKENVMSLQEGKKAYQEQIGVKLGYYSSYDYKTRKLTVFPAYYAEEAGNMAIDGKTGKPIDLYSGFIMYDRGGAANSMKEQESASRDQLTKEELDALEKVTGLISKEKAERILRDLVPGITAGMKVTNTSLSRSYMDDSAYTWEIGFDGAYGIVNAKTGELQSFYIYKEDSTKGNLKLSKEKAKERAESFLKQMAPESFSQSLYYDEKSPLSWEVPEDQISEFNFNYRRQVNGIEFRDNGLNITVNKASGIITQYNRNWYEGVIFPAVDNVMTQEAAFDIISKDVDFDLYYKRVSQKDAALVYDFEQRADFLVDPKSGEKLGWDGKPYKDASMPSYSDLKGHWSEKTVNKLLENGYYLPGDKFNPNDKITQIQFLRYLYSPMQAYYSDDELYKQLVRDKIIEENEKNPKVELTRQDAAKFIVRYLGQGQAAAHPEIFINPFKDSVATSYKGYAAISYGLGIMKGDTKGRFNGTKVMTNAEAAVVIYNGLQTK